MDVRRVEQQEGRILIHPEDDRERLREVQCMRLQQEESEERDISLVTIRKENCASGTRTTTVAMRRNSSAPNALVSTEEMPDMSRQMNLVSSF